MQKVKDFEVVDLGIEYPDYFQGFGCAFSPYEHCAYGVGDNPQEALEDCLEQLHGIDTEDLERRIREEFGEVPDAPNVMDECGIEDDGYYELPYYHIGIRYNLED